MTTGTGVQSWGERVSRAVDAGLITPYEAVHAEAVGDVGERGIVGDVGIDARGIDIAQRIGRWERDGCPTPAAPASDFGDGTDGASGAGGVTPSAPEGDGAGDGAGDGEGAGA